MQLLVVFLAVTIIVVSADLSPVDLVHLKLARKKCQSEFTVNRTQIERAQAGEMIQDPEFHCFMACILEGIHLMRPDGTLDVNAAIEKVPDAASHDGFVAAIKSCGSENGKNKCDTVGRVLECLNKKGLPAMLKSYFH